MGEFRFDCSQLPPAKTFYEHEGFKLGRANSKGWAMAKGQPPCHKSESGTSFSININHGGFVCFGCGAKGDMIKFVMLRDGCDFTAAAKTLGCSREGLTFAEQAEILRRQRERAWNREREIEQAESARRERLQLRDELHTTIKIFYDLETLLQELGPEPVSAAEPIWSALPPTLDCWRLEESEYCYLAGLENLWI